MVVAHAGIALWHHFHPWIAKTWTWKLSPIFPPHITENRNFCLENVSQETPRIQSKIDKNGYWASVCPLGVPLDPRITKTLSQVPKKNPQGFQNESSNWKNTIPDSRLLTRSRTRSTWTCKLSGTQFTMSPLPSSI